jgi:hypothetical protein
MLETSATLADDSFEEESPTWVPSHSPIDATGEADA